MPYITKEKRHQLDGEIETLHHALVGLELDDTSNNMEGNINYVLTRLLMMVYGDKETTCYSHINDALGLLESVKMEFYRKVAVPYENQKEFDNGPVVAFRSDELLIGGTVDVEISTENMSNLAKNIKGDTHG